MFQEARERVYSIPVFSNEVLVLSDDRIAVQGTPTEVWILENSAREKGKPALVPIMTFKMFGERILEFNGHIVIMDNKVINFWHL